MKLNLVFRIQTELCVRFARSNPPMARLVCIEKCRYQMGPHINFGANNTVPTRV